MFDRFPGSPAKEIILEKIYESISARSGLPVDALQEKYPMPIVVAETDLDPVENENFLKWAGEGAVIEPLESAQYTDFANQKTPLVFTAFHGTSQVIEAFNKAHEHGLSEGFLGRVNYFTSSRNDADFNYSQESREFDNKVASQESHFFGDEAYQNHLTPEDQEALTREIVRGSDEQVIETYVRTEKPYVVDSKAPVLELSKRVEAVLDEIASDFAVDNGLNATNYEELTNQLRFREDDGSDILDNFYEYENDRIAYHETALMEMFDGAFLEFTNEYPPEAFKEKLTSLIFEERGHVSMSDFHKMFKSLAIDEQIYTDVFVRCVTDLGYDSLILLDAYEMFQMDHTHGVSHIHIPDQFAHNIKAVHNFGNFDIKDPRILHRGVVSGGKIVGASAQIDLKSDHEPPVIKLYDDRDRGGFVHEACHYMYHILERLAADGHEFAIDDMAVFDKWMIDEPHLIKNEIEKYYGEVINPYEIRDYLSGQKPLPTHLKEPIWRARHEIFVAGFESCCLAHEGIRVPLDVRHVFAHVRKWIMDSYNRIMSMGATPPKDMEHVYAQMMTKEPLEREARYDEYELILRTITDELSLEDESHFHDLLDDLPETYPTPSGHQMKVYRVDDNVIASFSLNGKKDNPAQGIPAVLMLSEDGIPIQAISFRGGRAQPLQPDEFLAP